MDDYETESCDDFGTPRGYYSPISHSSDESEPHDADADTDESAEHSEIESSTIDIETISIALDKSPSPTVSTCSDDHKTSRNILCVQKEEAFHDWLAAKKFVYTKIPKFILHSELVTKKKNLVIPFVCLEFRTK